MLKRIFFTLISISLICHPPCYSQESFDYSSIAPHPRLLLTQKDENKLREAIRRSPQLASIHRHIIAKSDTLLTKEVLVYKKEGIRLLDVSREAIARIFYLSYSYRMTQDNKYLTKAEEELNAVCRFNDWNPTHFLDVGEMTMAVSIGYDWLYEVLKDSTKAHIREAILSYAFKTSEEQRYNRFLRTTNNWNQVCNAGLVYGALAVFENHPAESKAIIERALATNPLSLAEYAPDGNYPEGAGYWNYGTSFEVMQIAALESALGSDAGLSSAPGFLPSAEYMLFINGPTRLRYNYSDCDEYQSSNVALFWFAKKLNDPSLLFDETKLWEEGVFFERMDEARLLPAVMAFAANIPFSEIKSPTQKVWYGRGKTPVVMVRTDWERASSAYLGVKGGYAITSHAHMDAGSFVYDSDGLRWAMDFGMQGYHSLETKGIDLWNVKQNSPRWDIFRYNNYNHNTVTINGKKHRADGRGLLIETYDSETEKGGKFDLTEVFGGDVKSAVRKAVIKDDLYLEVQDEIATHHVEATVRWTMVTPSQVRIINSHTIELKQKGKRKLLKVDSSNRFELKIWQSEDPGTEYDSKNPGTVMVGFESIVPANEAVLFIVSLKN